MSGYATVEWKHVAPSNTPTQWIEKTKPAAWLTERKINIGDVITAVGQSRFAMVVDCHDRHGVEVTALDPAWVESEILDGDPESVAAFMGLIVAGRSALIICDDDDEPPLIMTYWLDAPAHQCN